MKALLLCNIVFVFHNSLKFIYSYKRLDISYTKTNELEFFADIWNQISNTVSELNLNMNQTSTTKSMIYMDSFECI